MSTSSWTRNRVSEAFLCVLLTKKSMRNVIKSEEELYNIGKFMFACVKTKKNNILKTVVGAYELVCVGK